MRFCQCIAVVTYPMVIVRANFDICVDTGSGIEYWFRMDPAYPSAKQPRIPSVTKGVSLSSYLHRRLDGVVVSVLATGPKGRRFKPGRGDGFLRAIKIRSTPSFGWEAKPEVPCRKYDMLKILWGISDSDRQNSNFFAHSSYLPQCLCW
jgi:hypothetical protein